MFDFYALIFTGAFLATAVWLIGLCLIAPALGLVDHPAGRKRHSRPTPIVGGLAVLAGTLLATFAALIWAPVGLFDVMKHHIGYLIGSALLALVGLWDDRRPVPARYKLLIQLASCILAVAVDRAVVADVDITIWTIELSFGALAPAFTVLVMLTITNAINMIDGADGLAGGIIFIALAVMAKATSAAQYTSAALIIALMGGLAAFLAINLPLRPNRSSLAFLGDCGSLVFGFTLAYFAIQLSALPNRVFKPSTALWLFFIPVVDTIWLYLRRTWYARAPFAAGRDHIHHLLMERVGARRATWLLLAISAILAGGAYLAERLGVTNIVFIGAWIFGFLVYGCLTQNAWRRAWEASRSVEQAKTCATEPAVQ